MSKLYIFGDSYSTPGLCTNPKDSFWGLLARDLADKIESIENYSWPGNNIDSIGHVIVSIVDQFEHDDYLLIGIPHLQRLTLYNQDRELSDDKHMASFSCDLIKQKTERVFCHSGLTQLITHQLGKDYVMNWNQSWAEAQALRMLLTLDAFLINKIKFEHVVYFNLSEPYQPLTQWPTLCLLQQQVLKNPRMVLFENTYYSVNKDKHLPLDFDQFGWAGHHGPEGNKNFYETTIRPLVSKLGWL